MISIFFSLFILSSISIAMNPEQTQGEAKAFSCVGKLNISCDNCRKLHTKCSGKTPCDKCVSKKIPCIRSEKINCLACHECHLNHRACDQERPCRNCRDLGLECMFRMRCTKKKNTKAKLPIKTNQPSEKPKTIEPSKKFIWVNYDFQNTFPSDESSAESSDELLDDYNSREETQGHEPERSKDFFPFLSEMFPEQSIS